MPFEGTRGGVPLEGVRFLGLFFGGLFFGLFTPRASPFAGFLVVTFLGVVTAFLALTFFLATTALLAGLDFFFFAIRIS